MVNATLGSKNRSTNKREIPVLREISIDQLSSGMVYTALLSAARGCLAASSQKASEGNKAVSRFDLTSGETDVDERSYVAEMEPPSGNHQAEKQSIERIIYCLRACQQDEKYGKIVVLDGNEIFVLIDAPGTCGKCDRSQLPHIAAEADKQLRPWSLSLVTSDIEAYQSFFPDNQLVENGKTVTFVCRKAKHTETRTVLKVI